MVAIKYDHASKDLLRTIQNNIPKLLRFTFTTEAFYYGEVYLSQNADSHKYICMYR